MNFNALKKNLKKDFSAFPIVKIALLGDTPTQLLHHAIKGYGYETKIQFDIYESGYDQIDMQIFDLSSEMYMYQPEYILIFSSTQKLKNKFYKTSKDQLTGFSDKYIDYVSNIVTTIKTNLVKSKIIFFNFPEFNDAVFGNFSNKTNLSFLYHIRKINFQLMELSIRENNFFLSDIAALNTIYGKQNSISDNIYIQSGFVHSLDFIPFVAKNTVDIIVASMGKIKKCLILDLDNTTWGGIIGDDGIEGIQVGDLGIGKAFTELQQWAKQLEQRGIILCICSKNTEEVAKEPFEKHPEMVLKLDDIAVFVANWDNKADNIRYIKAVLNIGFDSMVFLDDNPFERNIVRKELPDVCVPELPEDPADYLSYIQKLNLFETISLSEEDENRTKQYQEEAKRVSFQQAFTNEDEFLESLDMVADIKSFDRYTAPRIAQLSQRSNQFNLRTIRYTEQDIICIAEDDNYYTFSNRISDKHGDYGLISAIILQKQGENFFIDTWFMSCRVLKRGVENFTLNTIVELANSIGVKKIIGEYIPTSKNAIVKDHYKGLGFIQTADKWELSVDSFQELKTHIKTKKTWKFQKLLIK